MIFDIAAKRVDTVLMTEISRLSRSHRDWLDLREFFDKHQASFIASRQNFDTASAMGRAMLGFATEFAQLERELISERVIASNHARALRGLWIGGPSPYGLKITDRPGYLEISETERIIATEMVDIFLNEGGSVVETVKILNNRGFKRSGADDWDEKSFARWLRSRAVRGEVEANSRNKTSDQIKLREQDRYQIVKAVWDPLIPVEKWDAANKLLDENYRRLKVPQWKYHDYLLTGLVECAEGHSLTGASGYGRSGIKYPQYRHQKKMGCDFFSVPGDEVEKVTLAAIGQLSTEPELLDLIISEAETTWKSKSMPSKRTILGLSQKRDSLERKLTRASDAFLEASETSEKEMWQGQIKRIREERADVEKQIEVLNAETRSRPAFNRDAILDLLRKFTAVFDSAPLAKKQRLLRAAIRKITVQKDRLTVLLNNPGAGAKLFDTPRIFNFGAVRDDCAGLHPTLHNI